jgi:hypothetical protein
MGEEGQGERKRKQHQQQKPQIAGCTPIILATQEAETRK